METSQELNFLVTLLPLAGVIFIIAVGVLLLNQHFRKNLFSQKLEQEELNALHHQELLRSSIQAQEKERKRISGDLHDELGAVLSIARMHLVQLEEQSANINNQTLHSIQNIRNLTESALSSMRRISHELMPPQLEMLGIAKTLEAITERTNLVDRIDMKFVHSEELHKLPWTIQLGIYRISLELLTNTVKHAMATKITLHLNMEDSGLALEYYDNGIGLSDGAWTPGLGTKNLQARISAMDGVVMPSSSIASGFSFKLIIPTNQKN